MKDLLFDRMEENRYQELANVLGISYDELQQTEFEIDDDTNNDGLVVNLIVRFDESSPINILQKIKGLDGDNCVYLSPYAL